MISINLITFSLHSYTYKFRNDTRETCDITVRLACAGDPLKERVAPGRTAVLSGKPGCCVNSINVQSTTSDKKVDWHIDAARSALLPYLAAYYYCKDSSLRIAKNMQGDLTLVWE